MFHCSCDGDCNCNPMTVGVVLTLVGLVYILKDLGYVAFDVSIWAVLVFLVGLFMLMGKGKK